MSFAEIHQIGIVVGFEKLVVEELAVEEVIGLRHSPGHRRAARVVHEARVLDAVHEQLTQLHTAHCQRRQLQVTNTSLLYMYRVSGFFLSHRYLIV